MSIISEGHPIPSPSTTDCIDCCMEQGIPHAPIPFRKIGTRSASMADGAAWTYVIYGCPRHGDQSSLYGFYMIEPTNQGEQA